MCAPTIVTGALALAPAILAMMLDWVQLCLNSDAVIPLWPEMIWERNVN